MNQSKLKILVLCTGNSCRSQMANGYLASFAQDKASIYSAGVETHGVNLLAIQFTAEDGIDISHHTSNNISEYEGLQFDYVITVCDHAAERCPVFPAKSKVLHHNFQDSSKTTGSKYIINDSFRKKIR